MKAWIFEKLPPIAVILGWVAGLFDVVRSGNTEAAALYLVPVLVFLLVQASKYFGVTGEVLKWASYVVSLIVAAVVLLVMGKLPMVDFPLNDPITFLASILTLATVVSGFATIIYEALNAQFPNTVLSDKDMIARQTR